MRVEHLEDALRCGDRLLQVRVHAAQFFRGTVHQEQRPDEQRELPRRQRAGRDLLAAVHERGGHADAANQLHQRREARERRRHLHVRAKQVIAGAVEFFRFVPLGAERFHDSVAREGFGAEMRNVLERLLAPPRRPAHALAEPDERVDDQRSAGQADDRQPAVVVQEECRIADERERLAREIAGRFRHGLLHLADVVVDPGQQAARRAVREKARRLIEDVPVERVAHVHHNALPDVGHQIRRHVRADALQQVDADDGPRRPGDVLLLRQQAVENRPNEVRETGGPDRVDDHPNDRPREPAAVRRRVAKQTPQRDALSWH